MASDDSAGFNMIFYEYKDFPLYRRISRNSEQTKATDPAGGVGNRFAWGFTEVSAKLVGIT